MQTFIGLISLQADSGSAAGAYRDALGEGASETRKVIEDHGGKLVEIYLTMGQYDSVAVMQFPDAVACAQGILALREQFGLGTQTLQAFPESQWPEVAEGI